MLHLANLTLILILWLNLIGLSLFVGAVTQIRNGWLTLTLGPWLFCSTAFLLEFLHGFGNLQWVWLITTGASAALIVISTRREKFDHALLGEIQKWIGFNPLRHAGPYVTYFVIFLYALGWRYAYPDVDSSGEKLADLSYICSYLPGTTLPAPDVWLYPALSTQYYSFQYYAAALMGRIFGLDAGTTYNLAFCVVVAMAGTAAVGICRETIKSIPHARKWSGWLVPAGWILGGSGVSGIIYLLTTQISPWASMRFIGCTVLDKAPLGPLLDHYSNPPNSTPLDLPGEPFAYCVYVGDYHPPLSGHYLAMVAILALTLYHREKRGRYLAIPGACLAWSTVSNTWIVPVAAVALGGWCLYNFRDLLTGKFWYLAGGALAGYITIYPYFRYFASTADGYHMSLKLVPLDSHTPPLLFLIYMLPAIGLSVLALFSGEKSTNGLGWLGLGLLFFSEFFYIQDLYGGQFARFNSTLKWWYWIGGIILLTLGVRLLSNPRKWIVVLAFFFISYPLLYTYDLATYWWQPAKDHFGQLGGHSYLINGREPGAVYLSQDSPARRHPGRSGGGRFQQSIGHDAVCGAAVLPGLDGARTVLAGFLARHSLSVRPDQALLWGRDARPGRVAEEPGHSVCALV